MRIDRHNTRTPLVHFPLRGIVTHRGEPISRRLVMPELLENRNAPGALVPWPVGLGDLATNLSGDGLLIAESLSHSSEEIFYYRSDSLSSSSAFLFPSENFVNALRTAEASSQLAQTSINTTRQSTESRSPVQLVAINKAFESYSLNDLNLVPINPQLPPPVIQPIEPPDDQQLVETPLPDDLQEETDVTPPMTTTNPATQTPALITQPVITAPESEHNQPNNQSDEQTPPPVIQPVITDPESEHNQPNSAPETPPPLIQPVIMDPESEHNQG